MATRIKMKILTWINDNLLLVFGTAGGGGLTIAVNWEMMLSHAIEGSIVAFCGGFCGALAAYLFKKIVKE